MLLVPTLRLEGREGLVKEGMLKGRDDEGLDEEWLVDAQCVKDKVTGRVRIRFY